MPTYGVLNGNLVTLDGNIVVHPGGVVNGDVLTFGGMIQMPAATSGERSAPCRRRKPAVHHRGRDTTLRCPAGVTKRGGTGRRVLTLVALGFDWCSSGGRT